MKQTNLQTLEKRNSSSAFIRVNLRLLLLLLCSLSWPSVFAEEIKLPPKAFTVLTESAPRDIPLRDLKLREAGLKASPHFQTADEIRVFKDKTVMNESPLARIWINAAQTNTYWFYTGGKGTAENFVIQSNRAVVIVTRASTNEIAVPKP